MSNVIKHLNWDNIVLLDDGNQTIEVQKEFTDIRNCDLFTMYDLPPLAGQQISINTFEMLKEKLVAGNLLDSKNVTFIGGGLVKAAILPEDAYVRLMIEIGRFYHAVGLDMLYIPHRTEDETLLTRLSVIPNIKIKHVDYPVELIGIIDGKLSSKVSSFFSTALITMRDIYGVNVECFKFEYNEFSGKDDIDGVYDYYEKEMSVIDLTESQKHFQG